MDSGQISIADTSMNPLLDDFILNFDYLHDIGSITETQWNTVKKYKVELRNYNSSLQELQASASKLQTEINKLDAKIKVTTEERDGALERITEAEQTLQALPQSESIERTLDRPVPVTFFEDPENPKLCKGKFNLPGIDVTSVEGYQLESSGNKPVGVESISDSQGKKYWLRIGKLIQATSVPNEPSAVYGIMDDMGYLSYMITSRSYFEKQPEESEAPTVGDSGLQSGEQNEEANPDSTEGKIELEHTLVYFTLTYNEHSYYKDIIETFSTIYENKEKELEQLLEKKAVKDDELNRTEEIEGKAGLNIEISKVLTKKNVLNQEFERKMGSALREGYWTPENTGGVYENKNEEIKVVFTEPDEDTEEVGYRYDSIENQTKDLRSYCPFIELPEALQGNIIIGNNETAITNYLKDLTLILKESSKSRDFQFQTASTPTPTDEDNEEDEEKPITNALAAGYYSFKPYATSQLIYFQLEKDINISGKLFSSDKNEISIWFQPEQGDIIYFKNKGSICPSDENGNPVQILKNLSDYLPQLPIPLILKNNSGYVFAYKKEKEQNKSAEYKYAPILILNNDKLDYSQYDYVGYGYSSDNDKFKYDLSLEISTSKTETEKNGRTMEIVYPRIILNTPNINSDSTSTFKIYSLDSADTFTELTRYNEYNVVKDVDAGEVRVSLKISENNTFATFNKKYKIQYQVSHANEHLYKDAYEVALENSKPRFSYEVSVSNLPHDLQVIELGQLAHINDYLLGAHRMRGYVSGISYNLNEPQSDSLTLQNYKTKFEDLFSTITASSEAMKTNQRSYDAAASSFDNKGNINGDILQNSIDANEIAFNFSNTSVKIDDEDGILLTNKTAYANGVYGQVAIRGGGIFMSDSVDQTSGLRYWNTGITPHGINASLITTGQLDTNIIRIFAGSDMAFLWNAEGLNAYKREGDSFSSSNYIRFSGDGLHYKLDGNDVLSLDWDNGLLINANEGTTQLDGKLGLVVYDGKKSEIGDNWLVRIGKFTEDQDKKDTSIVAGMRLYEKIGNEYICSLDATNNGQLWLKRTLTLGGNTINQATAGISGLDNYSFWAGKNDSNIANSSFYVTKDGYLKATNANIQGSITATTGAIGDWIIEGDYLAYKKDNNYIVGLYSGSDADGNQKEEKDPVRIFAGGTNASNGNFQVTQNGYLLATQAHFGNKATYIELKTEEAEDYSLIKSSNYYPNFAGWKIDSKGYAEFENVKVRGELSTVVFKKDEVSTVGGKLYISPSWFYDNLILKENIDEQTKERSFFIYGITQNTVTDGLQVSISGSIDLPDQSTVLNVTDLKGICKTDSSKEKYIEISDFNDSLVLEKYNFINVAITSIGFSTANQYILIDAQNSNGPYIDIIDQKNSKENLPVTRLGSLTEIVDDSFVDIQGYGLYSQNAFLTGQLVLPDVGLTNQDSVGYDGNIYSSVKKGDTFNNTVRFWAGGSFPKTGEKGAPFVVTQDGTLYASRGIFSGELQTAGIIVETDNTFDQAKHKRFYIAKEHKKSIELKDYILNMDANGLSVFDGSIAAYSDSSNTIYGTAGKYLEPDLDKNQVGIENIIPYFYTYDDQEAERCDSRWVAKAGHIFDCKNGEISSISFKDGIHFYNKAITSLDNYRQVETEVYNSTAAASFALQSNCFNYSGIKMGINMAKEDSIIADINIRGTIGVKGKVAEKNGIIISPVVDKSGKAYGIDIISIGLKE